MPVGLMLGPWYVLRIVDSCCRWGRLDWGPTDDKMAYLDAILSPSRPHRSAVLKHTEVLSLLEQLTCMAFPTRLTRCRWRSQLINAAPFETCSRVGSV
jgi:hypothetical protein